MRKHWPWIVLLLIPLIPLWRAVFMGEAIGPFEQISQMAPWHGAKPTLAWDVLQADGVLQFYGWRDLVFEAWGKGAVPFWNPYELAGTPLLANSQSAALYPPHILMGVLHVPTTLAITLLAWFHLFWAGLGASRLVRALGGSKAGGVLAGASFALSAFMLSWTALSSVITTVCWIPWVLALAVELYRGEKKRWLGLAVCAGMMILGGHLQFVAYGFMALVILALAEAIRNKQGWLSPSLKLAGACVLGFAIAAPQLLAVLSYSKFSHRQNTPTEEGYAAYSASALRPFELVGLVYPKLTGDPTENVSVPNVEGGWPAYWPEYLKRGANFAEGALGIGPIVLFLLFTLRKRRFSTGIATVGALGLFLAFGTILNRGMYFLVPGWSSTGSPGRAIVLFVLACCVLAGLALFQEEEEPKPGKSKLETYAPLIGLALVSVASLWFAKFGPGMVATDYAGMLNPDQASTIASLALTSSAPIALAMFLLAAIFTGAALSGKIKHPAMWLAPTVLIAAVQLFGLVRTGDATPLRQNTTTELERYAFVNDGWEIFLAAPAVMPPNTGLLSRKHDVAGYDSLLHRDSKSFLDDINGQDSAPPANGNMMFIKRSFDVRKLAEAGVTEVWSGRELPELGQPEGAEGYFKYKLKGPGRASVDGKPAKLIEAPAHLEVATEGPGSLVVRDRNMPGWQAKIDGKPVALKDNPRWLEVDLPAGRHVVELDYSAPGFSTGLYLAIVGWLALGAFWVFGDRKNKVART